MKFRLLPAILFFSLALAACAQDAPSAPPAPQNNGSGAGGSGPSGARGGYGGPRMGMSMPPGRGIVGSVVGIAADHYTVKSETGEIDVIRFSANTRIIKLPAAGMRGQGGGTRGGQGGGGMRSGQGGGMGQGGNPPEQIKATDIKVGDTIVSMGEVDATARSVGAVVIALVDPERAKQMAETQANFGKTWLQGKVTAIDGVKVTLLGVMDNASHDIVADENTTFRKRREPITLADIQVGDMVRVDGVLKGGTFTATAVNVMGMPQGGTPSVPRTPPPQ
jgi:hypothetical protein